METYSQTMYIVFRLCLTMAIAFCSVVFGVIVLSLMYLTIMAYSVGMGWLVMMFT